MKKILENLAMTVLSVAVILSVLHVVSRSIQGDTLTLDQSDICNQCLADFNKENARWDAVESMFNTPKIANDNLTATAGIVYSKLNLTDSILNADIKTTAAIATSKLEDDAFLGSASTGYLSKFGPLRIYETATPDANVNVNRGILAAENKIEFYAGGSKALDGTAPVNPNDRIDCLVLDTNSVLQWRKGTEANPATNVPTATLGDRILGCAYYRWESTVFKESDDGTEAYLYLDGRILNARRDLPLTVPNYHDTEIRQHFTGAGVPNRWRYAEQATPVTTWTGKSIQVDTNFTKAAAIYTDPTAGEEWEWKIDQLVNFTIEFRYKSHATYSNEGTSFGLGLSSTTFPLDWGTRPTQGCWFEFNVGVADETRAGCKDGAGTTNTSWLSVDTDGQFNVYRMTFTSGNVQPNVGGTDLDAITTNIPTGQWLVLYWNTDSNGTSIIVRLDAASLVIDSEPTDS